jgi:hypothetical protein
LNRNVTVAAPSTVAASAGTPATADNQNPAPHPVMSSGLTDAP